MTEPTPTKEQIEWAATVLGKLTWRNDDKWEVIIATALAEREADGWNYNMEDAPRDGTCFDGFWPDGEYEDSATTVKTWFDHHGRWSNPFTSAEVGSPEAPIAHRPQSLPPMHERKE